MSAWDDSGHGCIGNTSPGVTSGWYDSSGCVCCYLGSTLEKVWERRPKQWTWLGIFLRSVLERFSFIGLWQLWPQLRSWIAWERPVKKNKFIRDLNRIPRALRDCIERSSFHDGFLNLDNVTLSALFFFIKDGAWQCAGYDSSSRKWKRLPPFTYLPADCKPDSDLFKEYLVCTKNGIVCVNFSKTAEDRLIVFNPLTGKWKLLPPLNHRRNPVLMHLVVDAATQSYRVIVAGSSRPGDERLSRVTEVFDSRTWKWTRTGDLPGPDYALNDYQSGVFMNNYLYCIAHLDHEAGRGIRRYNVKKGRWSKKWTRPIPFSTTSTILQLVESDEQIYLFSEQVDEKIVEHCIDRVEWVEDIEGGVSWSLNNVVRVRKSGGPSLEVLPEHTCAPYKKHQVCVYNTVDHSGVVYDTRNQGQPSEALQAPTDEGFSGEGFFSLNPLSFTLEPSFRSMI